MKRYYSDANYPTFADYVVDAVVDAAAVVVDDAVVDAAAVVVVVEQKRSRSNSTNPNYSNAE